MLYFLIMQESLYTSMPPEILSRIFNYFDLHFLLQARLINENTRNIIDNMLTPSWMIKHINVNLSKPAYIKDLLTFVEKKFIKKDQYGIMLDDIYQKIRRLDDNTVILFTLISDRYRISPLKLKEVIDRLGNDLKDLKRS